MKAGATRAVVLFALVYCLAGILFGAQAGQAASHQMRTAWRLVAWVLSAVAFGVHIVYDQLRLRSPPRRTALHASSAVGLGAFGLAVAANVHAYISSAREHSVALALALAVWPVMTMLPAFVTALVAAILLAHVRRSA